MFGWLSWTAIFASSSNMARNSGASAKRGWIFLSTSSLESPPASGSRARYTSAMPPAPRRPRTSYLPNTSIPATERSARRDLEVVEVQLGLPAGEGEERVARALERLGVVEGEEGLPVDPPGDVDARA